MTSWSCHGASRMFSGEIWGPSSIHSLEGLCAKMFFHYASDLKLSWRKESVKTTERQTCKWPIGLFSIPLTSLIWLTLMKVGLSINSFIVKTVRIIITSEVFFKQAFNRLLPFLSNYLDRSIIRDLVIYLLSYPFPVLAIYKWHGIHCL